MPELPTPLPAPDAQRMTRLAGGAAHLLRLLRGLRRARDEGTISPEQYEAVVDVLEPRPGADEPPLSSRPAPGR
ncbi:MAG: hypothetical protein MUC84_04765 [Solirubrobacteraceae bacterium]|nr:hypothetical protein [Solirubrobacteraceae bacterium]MCU0313357.1 hypothetical protein [Solirubrobacteraceae bacterium]